MEAVLNRMRLKHGRYQGHGHACGPTQDAVEARKTIPTIPKRIRSMEKADAKFDATKNKTCSCAFNGRNRIQTFRSMDRAHTISPKDMRSGRDKGNCTAQLEPREAGS